MLTAEEQINRLGTAVPRSPEIVNRIAGPRVLREKAARRRFRIGAALLLVVTVVVPIVTSDELAVLGGVGGASLLAIWVVLWLVLGRVSGHAAEIVSEGIAYPARVEVQRGGARARVSYDVRWKDSSGREEHRVLPPVAGAPSFGDEAVVLVMPGSKLVGILVEDYLDVV